MAQLAGRNRQCRWRRSGSGGGADPVAIGARPRRTIRFALWSGEEQGLLGSKAYAARHLEGPANAAAREKFNVYFNIDPGTGPVYGGISRGRRNWPALRRMARAVQGHRRAAQRGEPIGNTDHLSFTALGLPGFNPIQDYANYDVRTHHTNMDTFERVGEKDMAQSAVVFAAFAWHAAMRDEMIPRPRPASRALRVGARIFLSGGTAWFGQRAGSNASGDSLR